MAYLKWQFLNKILQPGNLSTSIFSLLFPVYQSDAALDRAVKKCVEFHNPEENTKVSCFNYYSGQILKQCEVTTFVQIKSF